MSKSPDAFRTISEVADWLDTPAHVLRFWESKFTQVKPVKRAGGRRYYRPADMLLLGGLKQLLHEDGLTIKGAQKVLREKGVKHVAALSQPLEDDAAEEIVSPPTADEAGMIENAAPASETVVPFKPPAPEPPKPAPAAEAAPAPSAPEPAPAPEAASPSEPLAEQTAMAAPAPETEDEDKPAAEAQQSFGFFSSRPEANNDDVIESDESPTTSPEPVAEAPAATEPTDEPVAATPAELEVMAEVVTAEPEIKADPPVDEPAPAPAPEVPPLNLGFAPNPGLLAKASKIAANPPADKAILNAAVARLGELASRP